MKIYIYTSDNPRKYAANFFADAFFKFTNTKFSKDYHNLPREATGKPKPIRLKNGELIHFSISHSGNYWGIAFANRPVGFDLQTKRPRVFSAHTLQKILSPGEILIDNNPLNNFVVKEAYAKLTGEGLSIGFSTINANDLIAKFHPYSMEDKHIVCYAFL